VCSSLAFGFVIEASLLFERSHLVSDIVGERRSRSTRGTTNSGSCLPPRVPELQCLTASGRDEEIALLHADQRALADVIGVDLDFVGSRRRH
jgi:hypothetical protein